MYKKFFLKSVVKMKCYGRTVEVSCQRCGGDGKLDDGTYCFYCNGKGYREIEVED